MIQIIAILCLAIYGAIVSLLIGLKHNLINRLGVNDAKAGMLFSSFMFAGAVGVIVLSSLIDILGHAIVTMFGFSFTTIALIILAFCRNYKQVLSVYILLSIGAMCVVSVGNTILPHVLFGGENASAATNVGNAFYGIGAFSISFYLTDFLNKYGYKKTILSFSLLVLLCAILSLYAEYPVIFSEFKLSDLSTVLTSSFFIVIIISNFLGAGVENGVGSWVNTYMSRLGATEKQANTALSFFFIAIVISRLGTATFVTPENTPYVLFIIAVLATVILSVMIMIKEKRKGFIAVILMGLLMGSVCPNIFGYMFSRIDVAYHGTSFGLCFAIGMAGGSILSGLVGLVSRRSTLKKAFIINVIGAILFGISTCLMIIM